MLLCNRDDDMMLKVALRWPTHTDINHRVHKSPEDGAVLGRLDSRQIRREEEEEEREWPPR